MARARAPMVWAARPKERHHPAFRPLLSLIMEKVQRNDVGGVAFPLFSCESSYEQVVGHEFVYPVWHGPLVS